MAKSKSVTTRVWVSRDCPRKGNIAPYSMWLSRPELRGDWWTCSRRGSLVGGAYYGVRDFHRLTGFRLKPGECKQVDMTISMVPVEGGE